MGKYKYKYMHWHKYKYKWQSTDFIWQSSDVEAPVLNGKSPDEIQLSPETGMLLNLTRKSDDHHVMMVKVVVVDNGDFSLHNA